MTQPSAAGGRPFGDEIVRRDLDAQRAWLVSLEPAERRRVLRGLRAVDHAVASCRRVQEHGTTELHAAIERARQAASARGEQQR